MRYPTKALFQKLFVFSILFCLLFGAHAEGQRSMTRDEYIATYRDIAIDEMRRNGIPASIKLAQGILESGFGNSELARIANNHFGIKCNGWTGRTMHQDDDRKNECFRAYEDPFDSYRDHSQFLRTRPWYASLFELDPTDYKAWAYGLRRAGYATNPRYAQLLIRVIEENDLSQYDKMALSMVNQLPEVPNLRTAGSRPASPAPTQTAEDFAPLTFETYRVIKTNNRIKYVEARPGDTPESLAQELDIRPWQILRYNELEEGQQIKPGQILYLQPKRKQGAKATHIVQPGETMYDISQLHGIRLDHLLSRNNMEDWQQPAVGQKILLRGRAR
ncbi:MAG: glucosaminidase domain-containing protein [Bacteroides sp.]|jgi:LysM repeat protein|nr:glucosaminidase domain-containing protein [Bacteroides sp.]